MGSSVVPLVGDVVDGVVIGNEVMLAAVGL